MGGSTSYNFLIFSTVILCYTAVAQQQHFVAGEISDSITYTDIIPDSIVSLNNAGQYIFFRLDADNDGIDDFRMQISNYSGLYSSSSIGIHGFDGNEIIYAYNDMLIPVSGSGGDTIYYPVVKPFDYGDTIHLEASGTSEYAYLCNEYASQEYYTFNFEWENIGGKYVGLKIYKPTDTVLCWMKVEVLEFSFPIIIKILEYAANTPDLTTALSVIKTQPLKIRPNPVDNQLSVTFGGSPHSEPLSYRIVDMAGITQKVGVISNQLQFHIDTNDLPGGVYILIVDEKKNKQFIGKFLKL